MAAISGVYDLIRPSTTTSTAITVAQVLVPTTAVIEVTRAWCNQSTITTSAQTRIQLVRTTTTGTFTSATPAPSSPGMQASRCVGGVNATGITATVEPTKSSVYVEEGFNIVNGWLYLPVPEERKMVGGAAATGIGLFFPTAPTSAGWVSGIGWLEYAF